MVNIKVLGSGCPNCPRLEATVRRVAQTQGIEAQIEKVSDFADTTSTRRSVRSEAK
jgi:hypothetical protein